MQLKLGGFAPMLISEFKICFLKTVTLFSIPPIYPHFPSLTYSLFPFFPLLLLPPSSQGTCDYDPFQMSRVIYDLADQGAWKVTITAL